MMRPEMGWSLLQHGRPRRRRHRSREVRSSIQGCRGGRGEDETARVWTWQWKTVFVQGPREAIARVVVPSCLNRGRSLSEMSHWRLNQVDGSVGPMLGAIRLPRKIMLHLM